jgi:hypothetical protein
MMTSLAQFNAKPAPSHSSIGSFDRNITLQTKKSRRS